ncbi:MAG: PilZ domain-containing protein [Acidobacteria bacterium]|nr:PilZ domain-containing protein [Acidobacteriota bacterium]
MKNNRRRSTRFSLALPALVHWEEGSDTRTVETQTKDISSTGMYLMLEKQYRPDSCIQFEVQLPNSLGAGSGTVLFGRGRLIRQEPFGKQQMGFAAIIERCEIRQVAQMLTGVSHRPRAKAAAQ